MVDVPCIFDSGVFDTDGADTFVFGDGYKSYTHTDSVAMSDTKTTRMSTNPLADSLSMSDALSRSTLYTTVTDSVSFSEAISATLFTGVLPDTCEFDEDVYSHCVIGFDLFCKMTSSIDLECDIGG